MSKPYDSNTGKYIGKSGKPKEYPVNTGQDGGKIMRLIHFTVQTGDSVIYELPRDSQYFAEAKNLGHMIRPDLITPIPADIMNDAAVHVHRFDDGCWSIDILCRNILAEGIKGGHTPIVQGWLREGWVPIITNFLVLKDNRESWNMFQGAGLVSGEQPNAHFLITNGLLPIMLAGLDNVSLSNAAILERNLAYLIICQHLQTNHKSDSSESALTENFLRETPRKEDTMPDRQRERLLRRDVIDGSLQGMTHMVQRKPCPIHLPPEISDLHVWLLDSGHCVLSLIGLKVNLNDPEDIKDNLCPVPVPVFLKGYKIQQSAIGPVPVATAVKYDPELGVINDDDEELW